MMVSHLHDNQATTFLRTPRDENAEDIVRAFARYLIDETASRTLPVSLNTIRKYLNLPVRREQLPGQRGFTTDDLHIYLNADDRETVQKFSLAHEFMEVMFLAIEAGQADKWLSDDVLIELTKRKETLCEMGAAELVMPGHLFRELVCQQPVTLARACALAEECKVSLTATLWRIIEMDLAPLVLIVWRRKHKPTEFVPSIVGQMTFLDSPEAMDPPKKMRVERVFVSPTFRGFIPTGKSVPATSIIDQAFSSGAPTSGIDALDVGPLCGHYYVEAKPVHVDGERRVMSLIYLD